MHSIALCQTQLVTYHIQSRYDSKVCYRPACTAGRYSLLLSTCSGKCDTECFQTSTIEASHAFITWLQLPGAAHRSTACCTPAYHAVCEGGTREGCEPLWMLSTGAAPQGTFKYSESVINLKELESASSSPTFFLGFSIVYVTLVFGGFAHKKQFSLQAG